MLNEFMNNLWGSGCTGVMVPGLGEIIDVRCKYGTDLQATIQTSGGKMVLQNYSRNFRIYFQNPLDIPL
jgi:hypothetical protein